MQGNAAYCIFLVQPLLSLTPLPLILSVLYTFDAVKFTKKQFLLNIKGKRGKSG